MTMSDAERRQLDQLGKLVLDHQEIHLATQDVLKTLAKAVSLLEARVDGLSRGIMSIGEGAVSIADGAVQEVATLDERLKNVEGTVTGVLRREMRQRGLIKPEDNLEPEKE